MYRLAAELGLAGFVGNDERGVLVEAEGSPGALDRFVDALRERPPPLAVVSGVEAVEVPAAATPGSRSRASTGRGPAATLVSPDTATCADCLAEMRDPADRRYRHPFINCTNCGPRFTIVTGVPYDRAATTMAAFPMCAACAAEYHDPADRRFHAQPVCCPDCGPTLRFVRAPGAGADRPFLTADPIAAAALALRAGAVVAVKGLGGYHLAALARDETRVGDAAGPQAPGGPAVRRPGARPRGRPGALPRRRRRGRGDDLAPRPDRAAAPPPRCAARAVGRAR